MIPERQDMEVAGDAGTKRGCACMSFNRQIHKYADGGRGRSRKSNIPELGMSLANEAEASPHKAALPLTDPLFLTFEQPLEIHLMSIGLRSDSSYEFSPMIW
jgi:hypothetical protein